MRNHALQENAQETFLRERELRETQTDLERCRMERDEWERTALRERMAVDEAKSSLEALKRDLELEQEARGREAAELDTEKEKSNNLQSVLQDFQAGMYNATLFTFLGKCLHTHAPPAKDHELRQAVKDYESQLTQTTQSLAEYKHRALTAEVMGSIHPNPINPLPFSRRCNSKNRRPTRRAPKNLRKKLKKKSCS